MIERRTAFVGVGLILGGLAACGGESGTNALPEALTQAEAAQVMSVLLSIYTPSFSNPSPSPAAGAARVPMTTIMGDTSQTATGCPAGGTALVLYADSLRVTSDTRLNPHPDTAYAVTSNWGGTAEVETRYQGCAATDSQGTVWTFDANPGLTYALEFDGDIDLSALVSGAAQSFTRTHWDGLWSGTFSWSSGSRSGQCGVSLQMQSDVTVNGSQSASTYSYVGQMCGLAVSVTS